MRGFLLFALPNGGFEIHRRLWSEPLPSSGSEMGGRRCSFRGRRTCGFQGGGNARLITQTHQRLRLIVPLGLGAWRAVKTAIPALEERDALTPACGLTRRFACVKARDFSRRRFFHVNLTGSRVAFGVGNGFAPSTFRVYEVY